MPNSSSQKLLAREHATILIPAMGVLFCCAAQLQVLEAYCAGEGCTVYQGFNLFGIPFYVLGIGLFFALLCCRAFVKNQQLYVRLSLIAIILDAPLLIWQTVFFPCSNCLVVAILLLGNAYFALQTTAGIRRPVLILIIALLVLVFVNGFSIVRQEIKPWVIAHNSSDAGRMFFSPSCGLCRDHIAKMVTQSDLAAPQLVPISLSDEDDHLIYAMARGIEEGLSPAQALKAAWAGKYGKVPFEQNIFLQLRLQWNRAIFTLANGIGLPFFSFHGTTGNAPFDSTAPVSGLCVPSAKGQCVQGGS